MNITSEHVNKKHQKTKHLVVSSKKASLHHPIQSDAGHYQIWELAILKFDPLRALCQNGPIWPHHEEHKETPVFFDIFCTSKAHIEHVFWKESHAYISLYVS